MPSRARKPPGGEDEVQAAFRVLREATEEPVAKDERNPAAVALGKLGASKGGIERAKKLSPARRRRIAKDAARARWTKKP
jgi:hypothetical protein